jgi:hypothetical protein
VENRSSPRIHVRLSAEVRSAGRAFTATTRDLSVGGVCLEADRTLGEGDAVQITLFLVVDDVEDASQPPIELRGRVAWSAPGEEGRLSTMGVRFEGLSSTQMSGLTRYLKMIPASALA